MSGNIKIILEDDICKHFGLLLTWDCTWGGDVWEGLSQILHLAKVDTPFHSTASVSDESLSV